MTTQTKSWQKAYLAENKGRRDLYFYCEVMLPPSMRKNPRVQSYAPIGYPGSWIPVVPVGDNPDASRRIASMLCWIFRAHVPGAMAIEPVLTHTACLNATGSEWYIWSDVITLDVVCAICGAIERVSHIDAEESGKWLCEDCIVTRRWHEAYKEPIWWIKEIIA